MSRQPGYADHVRAFTPNARLFLASTALWSLGQALLGITKNLYLKGSGFNEAEIGNVLAAAQLGSVFCTGPAALLLDRWRTKPVLLLAVAITIAGNCGQALLVGFVPILAASFLAGAGGAVFGVAASPFLARHSGPAERTHLISINVGLQALANTFGTLSVSGLERLYGHGEHGLRLMMLTGAAGSLLAIAPLALLKDAPVEHVVRRLRDFLFARDWRTLAKLCIPDALIGCGAGFTIPFINLYFQGRFGLSPGRISLFYAASHAMNMIGFFAAPALAQRKGRVGIIAATQLLSIPFFATLAFSGWLWLSVAAFLMRSLLMNMASPVGSAFAMDKAPPDQRVVTNSIRQLSWNLSWTVSASLGGWLIHNVTVHRDGYTLPMLITIGLYMVATALFLTFWAGTKDEAHGEPVVEEVTATTP